MKINGFSEEELRQIRSSGLDYLRGANGFRKIKPELKSLLNRSKEYAGKIYNSNSFHLETSFSDFYCNLFSIPHDTPNGLKIRNVGIVDSSKEIPLNEEAIDFFKRLFGEYGKYKLFQIEEDSEKELEKKV